MLILMIILGVTLVGILTGNIGAVEEMMKFFKLTKQRWVNLDVVTNTQLNIQV